MKIFRPHASPYFEANFLIKEKFALEKISDQIKYLNSAEPDVDVLLTDTHVNLDQFDFKNLKLIIHANSGYDNLLNARYKIPIVLGNEIRSQAVANYILACVFNRFCLIPPHTIWDNKREWQRSTLFYKKIQIIGLGHIGQIVQKSLSPLCPSISIYDPIKKHHELNIENADLLILSCELNETSKKIIDENFLKRCRPDLTIINAARGPLIDQRSLIEFLNLNPDAYAYLDVFEKEPTDFALFPKNTLLSSHIAGVHKELTAHTIAFEEKVLSDFMNIKYSEFVKKYQDVLLKI